GRLDRGARLVAVVDPADRPEGTIREALHTDREPVDTRLRIALEALALERAGIGLHRDLCPGEEDDPRPDSGEQAIDRLRREQARRAPAEEHRLDAASPDLRQGRLEIGEQGVDVAGLVEPAALLVRVEVAVRALAYAPW